MSTKITSLSFVEAGSLGRLPTKEGAVLNYGNKKREPVMGDNGVLGYSEEYETAPSVKVTIIHAKNTDEDALKDFTDETLTVFTNTDRAYTLKDAWVADPLELTIKDGQLEVLFCGTDLIPQ